MGFDELGNSLARTNKKLRDRLKRSFGSKKLSHPGNYPQDKQISPELERRLKKAEKKRKQKLNKQLINLALFIISILCILLYFVLG